MGCYPHQVLHSKIAVAQSSATKSTKARPFGPNKPHHDNGEERRIGEPSSCNKALTYLWTWPRKKGTAVELTAGLNFAGLDEVSRNALEVRRSPIGQSH